MKHKIKVDIPINVHIQLKMWQRSGPHSREKRARIRQSIKTGNGSDPLNKKNRIRPEKTVIELLIKSRYFGYSYFNFGR